MDLNQFQLDTPVDVIIKDPTTGKDSDIVITAYSSLSKVARNIAIQRLRKKNDDTLDEMTDGDYYSELVTGWKNVQENGKAIKFSKANVKRVIDTHSWLAFQLNVALAKAGYSPKS